MAGYTSALNLSHTFWVWTTLIYINSLLSVLLRRNKNSLSFVITVNGGTFLLLWSGVTDGHISRSPRISMLLFLSRPLDNNPPYDSPAKRNFCPGITASTNARSTSRTWSEH